ncbi:hypothetical protein EDB83DRAFT_2323437 [Lactarius deliciosus]|nr:hypothetical protein EDB83DRAFT_2323437 [Lactarius deliciosus]
MAVAGVVAALAGCWRWLVVFVQLEAASADLRHVVVVLFGLHQQQRFNNSERQHDGKAAKESSNDDDNDTIDSGRGVAITRQATAVIWVRWRGAQMGTHSASTSVSPGNLNILWLALAPKTLHTLKNIAGHWVALAAQNN